MYVGVGSSATVMSHGSGKKGGPKKAAPIGSGHAGVCQAFGPILSAELRAAGSLLARVVETVTVDVAEAAAGRVAGTKDEVVAVGAARSDTAVGRRLGVEATA